MGLNSPSWSEHDPQKELYFVSEVRAEPVKT